MDLFSEKVLLSNDVFTAVTYLEPIGMVHASLPEFVRAHAKHLLASPSQTRPTGIDLTSHQLIASKKVYHPARSTSCI
jgi:hypothetical protein